MAGALDLSQLGGVIPKTVTRHLRAGNRRESEAHYETEAAHVGTLVQLRHARKEWKKIACTDVLQELSRH